MPSAEIFLCAEEKIVGFLVFEHGIDRRCRGETDGSWRQPGVAVCVVGAVDREHIVKYSADGEVADGIFYGWVGLERHADTEPVEVDRGDVWLLFLDVGLFLNNGSDGHHLLAGEADVL